MSGTAVVRILARFKDARCADATHRLSRRRASLCEAGEPDRSNGPHGRLVRQILEKLDRIHRIEWTKCQSGSGLVKIGPILLKFPLIGRLLLFESSHSPPRL